MELLNTILYFLIVIVILVFVHEFGHFIAAKICKMRVDRFYLFFDFFNLRLFKFVKGDTEYGVGLFPLGGYVKVAGMIDESMDKSFVEKPPEPWEFRSKPVYQRMFVISAGVVMNALLAFLIFYVIALVRGDDLIDTTTIGYVSKNSIAEQIGLKEGDKVVRVNGTEIRYWEDIYTTVYIDKLGEDLDIKVERGGMPVDFHVPRPDLKDISERKLGVFPSGYEPRIAGIVDGKPAAQLGLVKDDLILEVNGQKVSHQQQFIDLVRVNAGKDIVISWQRNGQTMSGTVRPDADSTIGVLVGSLYTGPMVHKSYNLITAVPEGFSRMYHYGVVMFVKTIWKIIKGNIAFSKAIGGPIKIAQIAGQSAEGGLFSFLNFMAMLSMTLAIINILPFPALDGGHFLFLLWEAVVRKPVPYKVQIVVQNVGIILLMLFMVFIVYNDILHI
jgi:regulator of sigma E protease